MKFMRKADIMNQLKTLYKLKIILSSFRDRAEEVKRYKKIIKRLDLLEKELNKRKTFGDIK